MSLHRVRSTTLILALLCLCLPWLDIRCDDPNTGLIVTTQSGFQMLYGGSTTTVNGKPISAADRSKHSQRAGDQEQPVPLVIVYAVALVVALVSSLVVADKVLRWVFATTASGIAAGALVVQVALGFPLVEGMPRGQGGWTYTIWFWLALAFSLAAPLASVWERLRPVREVPIETKPSQPARHSG
jgi:hypothetical protein